MAATNQATDWDLVDRTGWDLVDRWVEALRSGEYQQTTMSLRNGDKFCCLGVLCDLYNPNGWSKINFEDYNYGGKREMPPIQVTEATTPTLNFRRLAEMNDDGSDFPTIAAEIERDLSQYRD